NVDVRHAIDIEPVVLDILHHADHGAPWIRKGIGSVSPYEVIPRIAEARRETCLEGLVPTGESGSVFQNGITWPSSCRTTGVSLSKWYYFERLAKAGNRLELLALCHLATKQERLRVLSLSADFEGSEVLEPQTIWRRRLGFPPKL